ncbi:MAG TPA: GNAT family N-acetyltransferase [Gaiellaceae bacterium]|nr:GNAT family N-acetyltransferase [Gaiellaceae bacterium]
MVRIERFEEVGSFYERVSPYLLENEAVHAVQLGFRSTLEKNARAYGDADPLLLAVVDEGRIAGVAVRTPPHNLLLSLMEPTAAEALADELRGETLPGAIAPVAVGEAFVARWPAAATVAIEQRLFEASEVIPPRPVTGSMRLYEEHDRELVLRWLAAFHEEALPGEGNFDPERDLARQRESAGDFAIWDDGGPVSFGAFGSPTPHGMRIGPIYTPPELRGRGYASALTAAITERILAGGCRFSFLATDLANPTSNSIYQRIGYRPVMDVTVWRFA